MAFRQARTWCLLECVQLAEVLGEQVVDDETVLAADALQLRADGSDALKRAAQARGYRLLTKPIKPASLRAFLAAAHQT